MKRIVKTAGLISTLALIAGSLPVFGQLAPVAPVAPVASAAANADGPRIKFAATLFDFGKITASTTVRHDYIFTNTGKAVLEITAVQPGCPGCTTALPWDRQVQPGQIGKISIQFNPFGFSGTQSKSITVTCNDPTQPTHSLQFRANVWQPIDVQPAHVYFMPAEGEEINETKVVRIVSNLDEPLTLNPPRSENPAFKMELKTTQPGKEFALHIRYVGLVSNAVPQSSITIGTSSTNVPAINVSARVMPQPALAVSPPQITLPAGALDAGHRHTQVIRNNSSKPIKVTEAAVNAEGVTVQVNESQPGKLFLLTVNFPANFQFRSTPPIELTITTTHPTRSIVKVPIARPVASAPPLLRPRGTTPGGPQ